MQNHETVVNVRKTNFQIYNMTMRRSFSVIFFINGSKLDHVTEYKYLGHITNYRLNEFAKLVRTLQNFNKSVGIFLRKSSTVDISVKLRLFSTICVSTYGLETIIKAKRCVHILRKIFVSHLYVLKKLLGFSKYFSNHYASNYLDTLVFGH